MRLFSQRNQVRLRWYVENYWYRAAIFLSVVFLILVASIMRSVSVSIVLLGLAVSIFAGITLLEFPPLGLLLLLVGTLILPWEIGTGTESSLNFPFLFIPVLVLLWIFKRLTSDNAQALLARPTTLPLFLFMLLALLGLGFGQIHWFPVFPNAPITAQVGGMAIVAFSILTFLVVGEEIKDIRWLELVTWSFLVIGGIHSVARAMDLNILAFPEGTDGSVFWIWIVALASGQSLYNKKLNPIVRFALGAVVLSVFAENLLQGRAWTSGWLPPLVALLVVILAGKPQFGGAILFLGTPLIALNWTLLRQFLLSGDNQYSLLTRLEAWRILLEVIRESPIFGLGFANYHWYTPNFPILGYYVSFNSHNNYLDIAAQLGVLGLICFLWFAWVLGKKGWQMRMKVPQGFPKSYLMGALGGLAGTLFAGLLGDWFLPFVYNLGVRGFRSSILAWIFMGGIISLSQLTFLNSKERQDELSA